MTDRCTDNQHKAEHYLSRFQGTPLGHLIDGKAVAGGCEPALENCTPIDGTVINSVAMGGKAEIDLAVEAAAGAFAAWRTVSGAARRQLLHRIADAIEARADFGRERRHRPGHSLHE